MEWSAAGEDELFSGVFVWDGSELISRGDGGRKHLAGRPCFCLFTAAVRVEASVKVTGEQVQPHNMSNIENSDSPLAFQVQLQRQRRPPVSLTFWAPSEASGLRFRVGTERWTGHRGTVLRFQKVQTFSMCCSAGGVSQELLLDVAAESTPEPTKPEGVSVRFGYESKNLHTHWWHSRSVKELSNCSSSKPAANKINFHGILFTVIHCILHFF